MTSFNTLQQQTSQLQRDLNEFVYIKKGVVKGLNHKGREYYHNLSLIHI